MKNKIEQVLYSITNPASGKTLKSENRINEIVVNESKVELIYNRDGISPEQKRNIENSIYEGLKSLVSEDKIFVKTVSSSSNQVYSPGEGEDKRPVSQNKNATASIKTGHGTIATKKRVEGVKHVLAVGSGKGGVGKSSFSVNLALTLSKMGKKVGLIDADIYGPSLPMMVGKRTEKPFSNNEKKIIPVEAHGVSFISFGLFIEESDPVIWRGPMLGGVLNQFLFDVDWKGRDYLIIDLPPGTGDIQLSMVQSTSVDGAIVISTPQDVSMLDAKKGLFMFQKLNVPIVGMVENMSYFVCDSCDKKHFIFGEGGVETACEELKISKLGAIPLEPELRAASDLGTPYMANDAMEGKPVWDAFFSTAKNVEAYFSKERNEEKSKKGFLSKILKKGD